MSITLATDDFAPQLKKDQLDLVNYSPPPLFRVPEILVCMAHFQ